MRGSFLLTVTVVTGLLAGLPAQAAETVCLLPETTSISPTQAAEALRGSLPSGLTLSSASETQIIEAFKSATSSHEGYGAEIAALIAVGRPEFLPALSEALRGACPSSAETIIDSISSSAASPSVDELAALAMMEGAAPASGPAGGTDPDGSPQ